ncbi:hypothetical protein OAD13_00365 [Candidatus Pelagibacter sp.]|nr:hypothetical protein [Candidatus Pelagibacter sp.]
MIIGLDHLSLNLKNKESFKKKIKDYEKIFEEKKLNHKEKKIFLKNNTKSHIIGFYNSQKNVPPIEKTFYINKTSRCKNIIVKKNEIFLSIASKKKEFLFWKKIFDLKQKNNVIKFLSFYDQKKYKFYFKESLIKKNYLDSIGFTSICFVSTDIHKTFKSCKDFNIEISNIFRFKINKKIMNIFFCRSPGGIILEIVQYNL